MQEIDRRKFVKFSGAGLLGFSASPRWKYLFSGAGLGERRAPENPVVLRSAKLEVTLDRKDAAPYRYRLLDGNLNMRGEDLGGGLSSIVCALEPWEFRPVTVAVESVKATGTQADFACRASWDEKPAVTFVLRYRVDGATVFLTMEDIVEHDGFQLIQVELPRLATVGQDEEGAWLAHGEDGGSVAMLNQAKTGHLAPNRFWGDALATLPIVMVGNRRTACILETTAYMDGTGLAVWENQGRRGATLGTVQTHRVNGSLSYDMNEGPGTPRISGDRNTPNLLIEQQSACRLDFITSPESGRAVDWLDAAKLVRQRMPAIPSGYYHDKFVHNTLCDLPRPHLPVCTFEQLEDRISQLAALIDNAPQIVHMWGWQFRGKDTGYPSVAEVDRRLGTYDDLIRLKQDCEKYNALVTFADNYDDAYKSSPAWSDSIIARRPDGQLWFSRNWTGESSYVLGMAKYMDGPGTERVHFTCDHYKLRETTHVDVLTYFSIRNDWDPEHPASGIKNLHARYKVLDLFKQHGVDVSSEFIRYAFIGKVSFFQNGMSGGPCPFGGEPIPLQAAIYRKSAIWGQQGHPLDITDRILTMLFYNGYSYVSGSEDPPFNAPVAEQAQVFYLSHVPWFKLHQLHIESFRREGDRAILGLEGGSVVEVNHKTREYSVHLEGVEVARNGNTFCPLDDERIALYSLRGGALRAKLPAGWDSSKVAAISLAVYEPDRHELAVKVADGFATVTVPARRGVMLYRDGGKAKQRLLSSASAS